MSHHRAVKTATRVSGSLSPIRAQSLLFITLHPTDIYWLFSSEAVAIGGLRLMTDDQVTIDQQEREVVTMLKDLSRKKND